MKRSAFLATAYARMRRARCGFVVLSALALAHCASPTVQQESGVGLADAQPARAQAILSAYRRAHGLGSVAVDPTLESLAAAQAMAMARANELSHSVAGSLGARLDAARLQQVMGVENVSAGYFSLDDALAGWRRSPAHNANLLRRSVNRMGIASAYAPGTRYRQYWALVLTD